MSLETLKYPDSRTDWQHFLTENDIQILKGGSNGFINNTANGITMELKFINSDPWILIGYHDKGEFVELIRKALVNDNRNDITSDFLRRKYGKLNVPDTSRCVITDYRSKEDYKKVVATIESIKSIIGGTRLASSITLTETDGKADWLDVSYVMYHVREKDHLRVSTMGSYMRHGMIENAEVYNKKPKDIDVELDHNPPVSWRINELQDKEKYPTIESIQKFLQFHNGAYYIRTEDHKKLNTNGLKDIMPEGYEAFDDPMIRYETIGIKPL
tara:strand:+ start:164 stop:976 length:813 start_codon:yes stop_codon:yes gene_type:complete